MNYLLFFINLIVNENFLRNLISLLFLKCEILIEPVHSTGTVLSHNDETITVSLLQAYSKETFSLSTLCFPYKLLTSEARRWLAGNLVQGSILLVRIFRSSFPQQKDKIDKTAPSGASWRQFSEVGKQLVIDHAHSMWYFYACPL